ncbi:uncharacterized protein LOC134795751 [Cydia splendana]|uniref:uncharacterized protein LOC134795751 n=1 Tax=Cydia splendana TaxID=1100963 RepID=UPI0028F4B34B
MGPKKGKLDPKMAAKAAGKAAAAAMMATGPPPKPKKIPPPPACFTPEDIVRYKEMFKAHDEDNLEKIPLKLIPLMLRKLGFNPKTEEVKEMFRLFLEDDLVDTVELHEWYFMIEAKLKWGDDIEHVVTKAMQTLGQDEDETGFCALDVLKTELFTWGEPFSEEEFVDWVKLAMKDKTYDVMSGGFNYVKFIENMNAKDERANKEPINYFKLDQKTLAALAIKKAQEEKEEQEKKEAEKKAKEEAKRLKMIADGLLPPD